MQLPKDVYWDTIRKLELMQGMTNFAQRAEELEKRFLAKGAIPRPKEWRNVKICVKGVILGLGVFRHNPTDNLIEVDVCLIENPTVLEDHYGTCSMLGILFSEAFLRGTNMEIRFTKRVQTIEIPKEVRELLGQHKCYLKDFHQGIPFAIKQLARKHNIQLKHADQGCLLPSESRQLYMAITDFSEPVRRKIISMHNRGVVAAERVCFMVHSGIFTKDELEFILLKHPQPESVILGKWDVTAWLLYRRDQIHVRAALLFSALERKLAQRESVDYESKTVFEASDVDVFSLDVQVDTEFVAKSYISNEPVEIPWLMNEDEPRVIPPGKRITVLVLPRQMEEFLLWSSKSYLGEYTDFADENVAHWLSDRASEKDDPDEECFILVPRDFDHLPEEEKKEFCRNLDFDDIGVILCPLTVRNLDLEAFSRLGKCKELRTC